MAGKPKKAAPKKVGKAAATAVKGGRKAGVKIDF
jgi:hypothetical protein